MNKCGVGWLKLLEQIVKGEGCEWAHTHFYCFAATVGQIKMSQKD